MQHGKHIITLTNIKDGAFCKKNNAWVQACNQNFQSRRSVVELGHFAKHFLKNILKRPHRETFCEFFLLDTLKTAFLMENLTQRWTQSGSFFSLRIRALFSIFKKFRGDSFTLFARLWVWVNMHQYPWISISLKNAWINCSEYARVLNMPDHLTCSKVFWRYLGF